MLFRSKVASSHINSVQIEETVMKYPLLLCCLVVLALSSAFPIPIRACQEKWRDPLADEIRSNLGKFKKRLTRKNVQAGKISFLKFQDELFSSNSENTAHWKQLNGLETRRVDTKQTLLSLAGSSAAPGDVVVMRRGSKTLTMIYLGERKFADANKKKNKQRSFFLYPLFSSHGLEINTMPPRWHRDIISHLIPGANTTDSKKFKEQVFAAPAMKVDWYIYKAGPKRSYFIPVIFWHPSATYQVVRFHKNRFDSLSSYYNSKEPPKGFIDFSRKHGVPNPNTCAVRLAHALVKTDKSFFSDVETNSGIEWSGLPTRADDLAIILNGKFGRGQPIKNKAAIKAKKGVVFFEKIKDFTGTGHISLWDGISVVDGGDYFDRCKRVYFWSLEK